MDSPNFIEILNVQQNQGGFIQRAISGIIALIAIVCLISLAVFTCMLLINQNELRELSRILLSESKSVEEVATITNYINTLHSMQTVVDHNQILALVYSILSTICIGVGIYFLKAIYLRQKNLDDKAKAIGEMFEDFAIKDKFNSECNALYSYCISYKLYNCLEHNENNRDLIENGVNECLVRIRNALNECKNLATHLKQKKQAPSNGVSLSILGYAKTTLDAFARTTSKSDIEAYVEEIQRIIDSFEK